MRKFWIWALACLSLPGALQAHEFSVGSNRTIHSNFTSDMPLLLDNALQFRTQVDESWIRGTYYWYGSRYELEEVRTTELIFPSDGTRLVNLSTTKDRLGYWMRKSNLELALGIEVWTVGNNQGSYTQTQPLNTTRPQLPYGLFRIDQGREYFFLRRGHSMRNWLEGNQTYSTKIFQESEAAIGWYPGESQQFQVSMNEKEVISPLAYTNKEIDWSFTYGDHKPMEPNLSAYWKSWNLNFVKRIKGEDSHYLLDYVNEAALMFGDVQNVLSYGIYVHSNPERYSYDTATTSWGVTEKLVPRVTHAVELKGSVPLFSTPLSLQWLYHYEEVPMVALEIHQFVELRIEGSF